MFSYRHAFHAGNHADVLKHIVLIQTIKYLCQKETAIYYIDTHAGAGVYEMQTKQALKNAEFEGGIEKLWDKQDIPEAVKDYLTCVKQMNSQNRLRIYPGSPYIAQMQLREQDKLRLFELHPTEVRVLQDNFKALSIHQKSHSEHSPVRGKRVTIDKKDGFSALKAQIPPPSRRAIVLIDPPYEDKQDYQYAINAVDDAIKRFATGTYLIWYPILQRVQSRRFVEQLKQIVNKPWLNVSLSIAQRVPDGFGLVSSGMFVINPPWTLMKILQETMPYLTQTLQTDDGASFTLEQSD